MSLSWGADPPVERGQGRVQGQRPGAVRPHAVGPVPDPPEPVPASTVRHARLVDELAPMVGIWERLLATHLPDRSGRCRTCTQGGTGLSRTQWPCALHGLAEMARRRHGRAS